MISWSSYIKLKLVLVLVFMSLIMSMGLYQPEIIKPQERKSFKVEVKGEVSNKGVFEVRSGMTIDDLLKDVVLLESADLSTINRNELLTPEMVITIAKRKERLSINAASLEELDSLKGIGEKTALAIIEYREANGGFKSLEELMEVKGIGKKKFDDIKDEIAL